MVASNAYVTMGIDHDTFAVGVNCVREILDPAPMCRMPQAPDFLLGIIDVRGSSVPVIDLRVRMGLPAIPLSEHSRILVLDAVLGGRDLLLGLLVDRVFEVAGLDDGTLEPPPDIGRRWRSDYIQGVGRRSGTFVVVLDIGCLLAGEEAALLGEDTEMTQEVAAP